MHKAGAGACCQKEMEFPVQLRHLCTALLTRTGWWSCQKDIPWAGKELWLLPAKCWLWAEQFLLRGKASLEVVCEQSLEWVISWWKWPHPLWVLLALLPDSLCCGHTSLPDLLGVKTSSLSFCQGNAFPRDVLGQGSWEAQCIQALSGRMEPQEWLRGILCSGGSGYFPVGVTV